MLPQTELYKFIVLHFQGENNAVSRRLNEKKKQKKKKNSLRSSFKSKWITILQGSKI